MMDVTTAVNHVLDYEKIPLFDFPIHRSRLGIILMISVSRPGSLPFITWQSLIAKQRNSVLGT